MPFLSRDESGLIRLLGYIFLVIVLATYYFVGDGKQSSSYFNFEVSALVTVLLFIYLLGTFFLNSYVSNKYRNNLYRIFLFIDSMICGLFMAYLNSSELLVFMLMIIQSHVFITAGGLTYWFVYMITSLLTAILVVNYGGVHPINAIGKEMEYVGGFYTMVFALVVSLQRNDRTKKLINARLEQLKTIKKLKTKSDILSHYLSPQIVEMHEKKGFIHNTLKRKVISVCFIDIVGFSTLTEQTEPEIIATILKDFFSEMSLVAIKNGGTIDKFIGDGMMVFFGDPISKGITRDAESSVKMAIEMQRSMIKLNVKWQHVLHREIKIRIGINTGMCNVGNIGSETRISYTAIGKAVNIAARIEGHAEPGGICVGENTYRNSKELYNFEDSGFHTLKGMTKKENLYKVIYKKGRAYNTKIKKSGMEILIKGASRKHICEITKIIENHNLTRSENSDS